VTQRNLIQNETYTSALASNAFSDLKSHAITIRRNQSDLLGHLDICRSEAARRLKQANRAKLGQFLTPAAIARLMASMFGRNRVEEVRILDPGAGIGMLFSALVERLCAQHSGLRRISVTAYEIEPVFIEYLEDTIHACGVVCTRRGVQFDGVIKQEDYISSAVSIIRKDFFSKEQEAYTHAILNPPYHKLRADSQTRTLLQSCGIETGNLYTAFLALTSMLLVDGGEMVSITPRSFCNGVYFRAFRKKFLENMNIERLHLFGNRTDAFKDDEVLQENIIMAARRNSRHPKQIIISSSLGMEDDVNQLSVDPSNVVSLDDNDLIIYVPIDRLESRVVKLASHFTATLESLGLQVSTGPVVDFRAKEYTVPSHHSEAVPLIYPNHFKQGYISWPATRMKKPDGILRFAEKKGLLLPSQCYVLVKRFSTKEERRRIVAAIYDPRQIAADLVGFENHLNYFHCGHNGLDMTIAKGLAAFLNSTIADSVFRTFSGHTQVNADDLRRLKYPDRDQLEALGSRIGSPFPVQDALDRIVQEVLVDSDGEELQNGPHAAKEKIQQSLVILKSLGLPRAQQNELSALTLLALLDLKPSDKWENASDPLRGITTMMDFFSEHYGKTYKSNTRESVRRATMHQFIAAGLVIVNPDEPQRPTDSPKVTYKIEGSALELMRTFGTPEWKNNVQTYLTSIKSLMQRHAQEREIDRIPIRINEGRAIYLSPIGHNVLIRKVIEEFCPRFAPNSSLAYVGDTGEEILLFDEVIFKRMGVRIGEYSKMPDLVIYCEKRNWLILVEAVTSHGPVNPQRRNELKELFRDCHAGLVFVTAFLTRKAMILFLDDISWETEVWVAEAPSHLIHFNGERFLGPYPS